MRRLDHIAVAKLRDLAAGETDRSPRLRALTKMAVIEARLETSRATLLRASGYYEKIVRRFERT
jgi:hypothetical protein